MAVDPSKPAENRDPALLIIGASARAAAMSASRAGISFVAIDLFADRDLQDLPLARGAVRVPNLKATALAHRPFPPGPWMYTGGLENQRAVVQSISRERELLGNSATVLRQVRNPARMREVLSEAGIAYPGIRAHGKPPSTGTWLWKPRRSCGGRNIRILRSDDDQHGKQGYLQEWISGESSSAIFVASSTQCRLVGTTQQVLLRDVGPYGRFPFQYVGSIVGPNDDDSATHEQLAQWRHIGMTLWQAFKLVGIFGVDAVIRVGENHDSEIVPIEVNPRYTASVELFEYALGFRAVATHQDACRGLEFTVGDRTTPVAWYGKSIVRASETMVIGTSFCAVTDQLNAQSLGWPTVADIPALGATIRKGEPIATVLACADSREELVRKIGWQGTNGLLQQLRSAL